MFTQLHTIIHSVVTYQSFSGVVKLDSNSGPHVTALLCGNHSHKALGYPGAI